VKSFLIDGEAVACDDNGVAVFEKLRGRREDRHVFLYAFDLIEINGQDLRREPIEIRSASWRPSYVTPRPGCSSTSTSPSPPRSCSACRIGLEGMVSKRLGSRCVSGGSRATG
jgi:bifunctional non-homologous end joining protein LigD